MQLKSTQCWLQRTPRIASVQWKEWMLVSLSLVYWFFYYLRSDSQQTTNKARYDAICVQECPNFNIWGCGLRSKRFEGSRLYSKIILGLQETRRWGYGLRGKNFRASGLRPPPLWDPVKLIMLYFKPASRCLFFSKMNSSKQENRSKKFSFYRQIYN